MRKIGSFYERLKKRKGRHVLLSLPELTQVLMVSQHRSEFQGILEACWGPDFQVAFLGDR